MTIKNLASGALFLFAHQDDEFGVFHVIEQELRVGRRVCCVYVTDGGATAETDRRNSESKAVLQKLGVAVDNIFFVGQQYTISDGKLYRHVDIFAEWLSRFLENHSIIETCYVPAWEGGHPDHDVLHAIAVEILLRQKRTNKPTVMQYGLYNGYHCIGPFFRVLSPLPKNGAIQRQKIPWRNRFRYIRFCLSYPSQWRSWIGLFPFVAGHYLFNGMQYLQNVSVEQLKSPPHSRPLYYERRGFLDWNTLSYVVEQLTEQKSVKSTDPDIPNTSKKR